MFHTKKITINQFKCWSEIIIINLKQTNRLLKKKGRLPINLGHSPSNYPVSLYKTKPECKSKWIDLLTTLKKNTHLCMSTF